MLIESSIVRVYKSRIFSFDLIMSELIGIIPLAGNATRMKNLPKFLLPCKVGVSLLENTLECFSFMNINTIVAGVSENNNEILSAYLFDKEVMKTKTMAETIFKLIQKYSEKKYVMIMPDTFFFYTNDLKIISTLLDEYELVVCLWKIKDYQIGKVGQCLVEGDEITDIIDKDSTCPYPYVWGMIAWAPSINHLIDPTWETIGNLIKKAIELKIRIKPVFMPGTYYDCGTYNEYFLMIKNEIA